MTLLRHRIVLPSCAGFAQWRASSRSWCILVRACIKNAQSQRMCSGQVTIMEIGLKDGHCNVCYKVVSAREHGLLCDLCDQWVHRRCGTGVSLNRYRDMCREMRRGVEVRWVCPRCAAPPKGVPQCAAVVTTSLTSTANDSVDTAPLLESTRIDATQNATPT